MSNIAFTTIDFFIIGILLLSILVGLVRGFIQEALSLVIFVLAIYAAGTYYQKAIDLVLNTFAVSHMIKVILAYLLVFLSALILGKIFTGFIGKLISSVGLSLFDRLLGGIFGAFRGILIVVVISTLVALTELPKSNEWQDAITRPAVETLVGVLHSWLPEDWANQLLNSTDIRKSK